MAEVQQKIVQLGEQMEIVTEQYNAANDQLAKKKQAQAKAAATANTMSAKLEATQGKVRQMASSLYRSMPFSDFTAMMTTGSPDAFLSQLSALDVLSKQRSQDVDALQKAKQQADAARGDAAEATAAVQKTVHDLAAKKAWIEQQLPKQKALLASLTAEQRQQVFNSDSASQSVPTNVPASGRAKIAVDAARSKLGAPYVWGAAGPSSFDCSGLTLWAWAQAGVSLPHNSQSQFGVGAAVSRSQLQPGDLVFFYSPIHHVGIYIGGGMMIHAPTSGDVVKVSSIDTFPYTGARRVG